MDDGGAMPGELVREYAVLRESRRRYSVQLRPQPS